MATAMSARPTWRRRHTLCLKPRPVWSCASTRCTRWKASASARLPDGSMPRASRHAKPARGGSARLSGPCCATLPIVALLVSAAVLNGWSFAGDEDSHEAVPGVEDDVGADGAEVLKEA